MDAAGNDLACLYYRHYDSSGHVRQGNRGRPSALEPNFDTREESIQELSTSLAGTAAHELSLL